MKKMPQTKIEQQSRRGNIRLGKNRKAMILVGSFIVYCGGIFSGIFLCSLTREENNNIHNDDRNKKSELTFLLKNNRPETTIPGTTTTENNIVKNIEKKIPSELKLPIPILVMGMMKAGTTSIYSYFRCGIHANYTSRLSHYDCKPPSDYSRIGLACGRRLRRNVQHYKYDAFKTIKKFDLYAELDSQENNGGITLPQWDFLKEIHESMPTSTWILNLRNPQKWLESIDRWKDLRQRLIDFPGGDEFPKRRGITDQEMIDFYNLQAQRVRDFVKDHPSHTLVEVKIDHPNAGQVMEDAFGISKSCWGERNVNNGSAIWEKPTE